MKMALCVNKQDFVQKVYIDHGHVQGLNVPDVNDYNVKGDPLGSFFKLPSKLVDRAICETDESLLQIIPYITLVDVNNSKIFTYTRGEASAENRLTGKCSIGIGGHVEVEPTSSDTLFDCLVMEAAREIEEEVGIPCTASLLERVHNAMSQDVTLMHHTSTAVDRVHLAVHFLFPYHADTDIIPEEGVITKGRWLSRQELEESLNSADMQLEHWSRMVVHNMVMDEVSAVLEN